VNADFDAGNGISACNGTPFVSDLRGTSAFFAAWRPYLFSQLAKAGAESLYQWDYNADQQFGEVDYNTGKTYLSYWVDYYLAHLFPSPPGADILKVENSNSGPLEALAVRNDDGSVVIMLANHQVRSAMDNNGPGVSHRVELDISALGAFRSAALTTIDASTDPAKGPLSRNVAPSAHMQISLNGYSVAFLQLLEAKPQFSADSVLNAASLESGGVSPGEIVSISGTGLGPDSAVHAQTSSPGVYDNLLAGTRVWFDAIAAPLISTSAKQVVAIVPYEVAGQSQTQLKVEYLGVASTAASVPVVSSAPGLFTAEPSGSGQAAAWNSDGTGNSAANPAATGSVISIMATGEGQTTPAGADGKIAGAGSPTPQLSVSAQIGGLDAEVTSAGGQTATVAGTFFIHVRIPATVTPGLTVPVVITVGSASTQAGVTIAVR